MEKGKNCQSKEEAHLKIADGVNSQCKQCTTKGTLISVVTTSLCNALQL